MQGKPKAKSDSPVDEAAFLVHEFGLTEREASELVTDDDRTAGETTKGVQKKRAAQNPLEDMPAAEAPENDLTPDSDEERLKPVVRRTNDRSGAG